MDKILTRLSVKMYKARFTKWGNFNKYNRGADMALITSKKRQRDAEGKKSTFVVRDKEIPVEQVERFVKRKKTQSADLIQFDIDIPTPTHIRCASPPLSPTRVQAQASVKKSDQYEHVPSPNIKAGPKRSRSNSQSYGLERQTDLGYRQSYRYIRPRGRIQNVFDNVRAPNCFLEHEVLFKNIANYIAGSLESGAWVLDKSGWLKSASPNSKASDNFFPLCRRVADAFKRLQFVQGRKLMSKACSNLLTLHQEERPRALVPILDVLIYWGLRGFVGLCAILQDFLRGLANTVLPERSTWTQICNSISLFDPECVEVFLSSYRCVVGSLQRYSGKFSPPSVKSEASLIIRTYRTTEPRRAEPLLRQLLSDYEQRTVLIDQTAIYITSTLASSLLYQKKYTAAETLVERALLASQHSEDLLGSREPALIEILARVQYEQHKTHLAEKHMRIAITSWAEKFGPQDTGIINCSVRLEGWLREWGREGDAAELRVKIDEMIGPDDIDLDPGYAN
jgi:hypothetical protein